MTATPTHSTHSAFEANTAITCNFHRIAPLKRNPAAPAAGALAAGATQPTTRVITTMRVLIIGATGSVGTHAVAASVAAGHQTRAVVRDLARANRVLTTSAELAVGDARDADFLHGAVEGVDAIVFTHGGHGGRGEAEAIDYGIVRATLEALRGRRVRIALMTSIGVTVHNSACNKSSQSHDWKRRAERLVRASGNSYTIVRPGWFDDSTTAHPELLFLQGDTRRAGSPEDGWVARAQIARVLVESLTTQEANRKTLELVAERGDRQTDLAPLFAALQPDVEGSLEGVLDPDTLPLDREPGSVTAEATRVGRRAAAS